MTLLNFLFIHCHSNSDRFFGSRITEGNLGPVGRTKVPRLYELWLAIF